MYTACSGNPLHKGLQKKELQGAPVAQLIERWTCDWKDAGSNPGFEGPCGNISTFSALCTVLVFWKRHKTEAESQLPDGKGMLNTFLRRNFRSGNLTKSLLQSKNVP